MLNTFPYLTGIIKNYYNKPKKGLIYFMELRVLQYFLAVAREQNITAAAESLFLSQPTLSRQLKDLENELGKQLFIRGKRQITLTEEGMILRKRASEIMELVKKAENEISLSDSMIAGDITVGAGETDGMRILTKTAYELQKEHPLIHFHVVSGDRVTVIEELDRGLMDFGLLFGPVDTSKYECIQIPYKDTWGVLMRKDSPLAEKTSITADDLWDKPLIISRQAFQSGELRDFFSNEHEKLNIAATYNLIYNGSLMVDEGIGYAICFDKLIYSIGEGSLCFRSLAPKVEAVPSLVWKKYQVFTKATSLFLQKLQEDMGTV